MRGQRSDQKQLHSNPNLSKDNYVSIHSDNMSPTFHNQPYFFN